MLPSDWYDVAFQVFKDFPNSIEVFDFIQLKLNEIFEKKGIFKLLETSNDFASSYCGLSFKKDQLLYHCSDCALDDTCVLCEKCFNFEAHKDHNYWYTIGGDNSGSCDCGEDDSWKNDLKCPHHSVQSRNETQISKSEVDVLNNQLGSILQFVMKSFQDYSQKRNEITDESCILILYNDENHSFDDVIDILSAEIEDCGENAASYAGLVDVKGFAPIWKSSPSTCSRLSRKFKTLTTSTETVEMAFAMILSTEIISVFAKIIPDSSSLRKFFVDWFLTEISDQNSNNLGILLSLDHLLWKSVRLSFNEILNSCNAINQESKKLIALTYCKQYNIVFEAFLKEKREPHLSVTNFSVQIFTLIPVAEYCLENSNILDDLFGRMIEIMEPGFNPSTGMNFSKLRSFNFQKFSVLTHDALHLTRNVRAGKLAIPNLLKVVDTFMYLLSLLTHMQGHFIKTGEHVAYDVDNNDTCNYICFEIQQIAQEFAKIIVNNCELASIWSLFEKHIDHKSSLSKFVNVNMSDKQIQPLFKSKTRCSFFGSLAWFYSSLVMEGIKNRLDLQIPSKVVKCFALDSLQRIIFSAEVRSGLWVRNGLIVRQQEYFYSSTVYHHLTYFTDLFNCIAGSRLNDQIPYIDMIIKQSCIVDYLQNQDQSGPVIDQFMIIFMNCCSSRPLILDLDQILINSLCTEAQSKSTLVKMLPESVTDVPEFREKLLEFAKLTSVNSIGVDAKLEITSKYLNEFDPFYWAFSMNNRLKAWSSFKEKQRSATELFFNLFALKYPISAEISKEADFLIEILLNFADSSSTDHHFALEMLLIILKAITNITSDQECLDRISDCIEKFKLKSNIPENILSFLASICPSGPAIEKNMLKEEEGKKLMKAKRLNIMASFKRNREMFITEPEASIDIEEQICVVCSEPGDGGDDNFLGFPIQYNFLPLISTEDDSFIRYVRGCYHLVHKKCFESLPFISTLKKDKKCTLCNSAIDQILPLTEAVNELSSLNLHFTKDCDPSSTLSKLSELEGRCWPKSISDNIYGLCHTLVLIEDRIKSIESIPLHQILTLTQLKRHVIKEMMKDSERNVNSHVFDLAFNTKSKKFADPLEVMEIIISALVFYSLGRFCLEDVNFIFSELISWPKNKKYLNFAINFVIHESFSTDDFFPSIAEIDSEKHEMSNYFKTDLIELPHRHDLFLKEYLSKYCQNCGSCPKSGAVCLLCGTLVCVGQLCCKTEHRGHFTGECYAHRKKCAGTVGVYLLIRSCALLLVSEAIGTIVPAPYVNAYGEHDFDLTSSSALFLNTHLYKGKLTEMWRNFELRDFIIRNMDNSRITSNSWSML